MQKRLLILLAVLTVSTGFFGCKKKPFLFSGRENPEEAFSQCMELSDKKRFQEAIECLEIFKSRFPDSQYALDAELRVGDAYFKKKDYLLAAETYQLFAKLHPTSDRLDYVYYQIGLCYLNETPKAVDRDQEHLPTAVETFSIVIRQFPTSSYAQMAKVKYDEARTLIAKRLFYIGRFYYRWGEYKAAIPRFIEIVERYPGLQMDEEALYYIVLSHKKLGNDDQAKAAAKMLIENFPESDEARKAAKKKL